MAKFNPYLTLMEHRIDYLETGQSSLTVLQKILMGSHILLDADVNFLIRFGNEVIQKLRSVFTHNEVLIG
jgi:hypothetical protein